MTYLLGMVFRLVQLPSDEAKHKLAYQNLPQLRRPVQLLAELTRASIRLTRLRRGKSLRRN